MSRANEPIEEKVQPEPEETVVAEEQQPQQPDRPESPRPAKDRHGRSDFREMAKKVPVGPGNFWNNVLSTVLLLIGLTFLYSYVSETSVEPDLFSVSEVAEQVKRGEVKEIVVKGNTLEVAYKDETRKPGEAKKETATAVSETLTNLGVTGEHLSGVSIDIQNETGFAYWASNIVPYMFPLLLLGFVIWFFSRSVRGAGMQALNFGSSKARVIDPNDQSQKVTLKMLQEQRKRSRSSRRLLIFSRIQRSFSTSVHRFQKE